MITHEEIHTDIESIIAKCRVLDRERISRIKDHLEIAAISLNGESISRETIRQRIGKAERIIEEILRENN